MKFIIDAHLPKSICTYFIEAACEAVHTSELPEGNNSTDVDIIKSAMIDAATIISKDSDFYHSFLLRREPSKLVLVKVGNMRLTAIKTVFKAQIPNIIKLLGTHDLLELHEDKLIAIV